MGGGRESAKRIFRNGKIGAAAAGGGGNYQIQECAGETLSLAEFN